MVTIRYISSNFWSIASVHLSCKLLLGKPLESNYHYNELLYHFSTSSNFCFAMHVWRCMFAESGMHQDAENFCNIFRLFAMIVVSLESVTQQNQWGCPQYWSCKRKLHYCFEGFETSASLMTIIQEKKDIFHFWSVTEFWVIIDQQW